MYATKRRRRNVKSHAAKSPIKDPPKSNPSKRHRERLNSELELLASLLPFEQNVVSKLDKLSILRLAVSYLRTKSYFQAVLGERFPLDNHLHRRLHHRIHHSHHLYSDLGFTDSETVLQALSGFLFVVTCDGEVFYASHTVEQYLGFHQSDIIHQSALELIHSEDREQFKYQLNWQQQLTGDSTDMTLEQALLPSNGHLVQRCFTVRFRCLLDNASGFITLEICGKIKALLGQNSKSKDVPLALFALCCPFGPLPLADVPSRDYTFKSKHKMDLSPISMDARGRMVFDYSDQELLQKGGYDLIHPEDLNYFAAAHQELIKTGSSGLIAYRLMTKDLHWIWLQTSSRVIYKNSKPDFILCIHRHLTEDEGRDLVRKRGSEFKLPYPIIDCDPSEFGVAVETEEANRIRSPRGKKSKGQLRDYLQTGRKRKAPYRDLYGAASFNASYNNTLAYYGCPGGGSEVIKGESSIYPSSSYPGSNLSPLDANLYRAAGYHSLCSALPGAAAATDALGSEMERHCAARYYLEPRQCQLEMPYHHHHHHHHSTGYYSDLLTQRSSKYSALDVAAAVAKTGFTSAGYGLDLTSGSRGGGHYDDEISRYETEFRKYQYLGGGGGGEKQPVIDGVSAGGTLLPPPPPSHGCLYGAAQTPIGIVGPDGLLSCSPLIANSQLSSLYRTELGTAFDCYSSCVLAKNSNNNNNNNNNNNSHNNSGTIHDNSNASKLGTTFGRYSNPSSSYKRSSSSSKSSPAEQALSGALPPAYPSTDGGSYTGPGGSSGLTYSPPGGVNNSSSDSLPSCSVSWPVSTKIPDIAEDEDSPHLRHQVSVVKQTHLFAASSSSPSAGAKMEKTAFDHGAHLAANQGGNALGGVATSVIQLSGRNRRCKGADDGASAAAAAVSDGSGTTSAKLSAAGDWHHGISSSGVYNHFAPILSSSSSSSSSGLYANHHQEKGRGHDSSSDAYASERNSIYEATHLYAATHGIVDTPKVVCFGESW